MRVLWIAFGLALAALGAGSSGVPAADARPPLLAEIFTNHPWPRSDLPPIADNNGRMLAAPVRVLVAPRAPSTVASDCETITVTLSEPSACDGEVERSVAAWTSDTADIPIVFTTDSVDIPILDDFPSGTDDIPVVTTSTTSSSTSTSAPSSSTTSTTTTTTTTSTSLAAGRDTPVAEVDGVAGVHDGGGGSSSASGELGNSDHPQQVTPAASDGLFGPVVIVLVLVLLVVPAMRIRVSIRRRRGMI